MAHVFRFFLPAGSAVGVGDVVVLTAADAKRVHRVLRLGLGEPVEVADPSGRVFAASVADPKAGLVVLDAELRPRFTVESPWGSASVVLGARGAHNVANALAAIAAAVGRGAPLDVVADALARPQLSPWRMEFARTTSGLVVLNDAYNANPVSMRAALDGLAALPASRRIAVLGAMAELGAGSIEAHRAVGECAAALGIEVISVGVEQYGGTTVSGIDEALGVLRERCLGPGDAVLVKASRIGGLERVAAALLAG